MLNEGIGIKNDTESLPFNLSYQMIFWGRISPELSTLSTLTEESRILPLEFILLEFLQENKLNDD